MEIQDKLHGVLQQGVGTILNRKAPRIVWIAPDAPVYNAVALMADNDIGALPVLDQGRLTGLISERNYARKILLAGRSSRNTRVDEIMDTSDLTVAPDTPIETCLEIMTSRRRRHLLVTNESGGLIAVVSIGDLVNAIIDAQDTVIGHLSEYISGSYPS